MKNKTSRRVARGLFHIISFLLNVKYKKTKLNDIQNIIIFRPDNLGDFILSITNFFIKLSKIRTRSGFMFLKYSFQYLIKEEKS